MALLCFLFVGMNSVAAQAPDGSVNVCVTLNINTSFGGEIGWYITDASGAVVACRDDYANSTFGTVETNCYILPNGDYTFHKYDAWGDGWWESTYSIEANETGANYTPSNACPGANISQLLSGNYTSSDDPNSAFNSDADICSGTLPAAADQVTETFTVGCPPCEIVCPNDTTVYALADQCGAQIQIDSVMGCANQVVSSTCTNYAASSDLVFTNTTVLGELSATTVELTVPTTLDPAIESVDFTICVNGDFGGSEDELTAISDEAGTVIDTLGNETGIDCSQFCTTITVSNADYNTWAADGVITFTLAANTDVNPICASNTLTASACIPSLVPVDPVVVNDFNNTGDASGFYPIGTTPVTFTTQDIDGNPYSCIMNVTVIDTFGPTVVCPTDVTLNLDAGECSVVYDFAIDPTDACGVKNLPSGPVTDLPGAFGSIDACVGDGNALACSGGNTSIVNKLNTTSLTGNVFINEICFAYDGTSWGQTSGTVRLYCKTGSSFPSFLSSDVAVAEGTFSFSSAQSGTVQCVALSSPYFYDSSCGDLYAEVDGDGTGGACFMADECNGITADGTNTYLASSSCGSGTPASFGFAIDAFFGFKYQNASTVSADPNNPSVSGDLLAPGVYAYGLTVEDLSGNTTSCNWNVTVVEFPVDETTQTLACNGSVNVSVDANCSVTLGADMFLEGGLYECYDNYEVILWPFGNEAAATSNINGVTMDVSNLMGQHKVVIKKAGLASCWGYVIFEDKTPPTLECTDITLTCTDPTAPGAFVGKGDKKFKNEPATEIGIAGGEFDNTFTVPFCGTVEAITVDVNISHTWISDLDIELIAPSGTTVALFAQGCGTEDDIVCTFADGAAAFDCAASASGATYAPVGNLSALIGEDAAGEWNLKVTDNFFFDGGVVNSFTVNMTTSGANIPTSTVVDNCGTNDPVLVSEVEVNGECTDAFAKQIKRTYTATDKAGMTAPECVQTITILRETLATLELPANYDGLPGNKPVVACDKAKADPAKPTHANGDINLDAKLYGGVSGVGSCGTIINYYTDIVVPVCNTSAACSNSSSYKVIRDWTIIDWCTGEKVQHTQIIKVMDTEAPVLSTIADMTVSTDVWGCGATINLPASAATDNCSPANALVYSWSSSAGKQVGNTFVLDSPAKTMPGQDIVITLSATDCCGNTSSTDFKVAVIDAVPPVVQGESSRTVSLSKDGVAKIFAEDFDDGSHDGCGPIEFFVKRMDDGGSCKSIDKAGVYTGSKANRWKVGNKNYSIGHGIGANNRDDNKEFNEIVHFCCSDLDAPVMVQFMVCDDANMDGVVGNKGDNCNVSMVEVIVQDKLAPAVVCPAPVTISCVDFAGYGGVKGLKDASNDFINNLFGAPLSGSTCGDSYVNTFSGQDACGAGTLFRTITVTGANGKKSSCTQTINITSGPDNALCAHRIGLDISNPVFTSISSSARQLFANGPSWKVSGKTRWFAHHNPEAYQDVNDPCYDSTFKLNSGKQPALSLNSCEGFDVPKIDLNIDGLCTEPGVRITVDTFVFAGDPKLPAGTVMNGCKKYLVHYEVIDNCVFDENYKDPITGQTDPYNSKNGYYELYLEIDAFDNVAPEGACEDITVAAQSCTGYTGTITGSATDNCTAAEYLSYQWKLDVGADDKIDFPKNGWMQKNTVSPSDFGETEFPIGKHKILWLISDGCGNNTTCTQTVTITGNEKEPTPVCFDGISTAVMEANCAITLSAELFNKASFDNCAGDLTFTMIPEQDVDASWTSKQAWQAAKATWVFDNKYIPNGVSSVFQVRMYVTDADGNYDYCNASLRLNDNLGGCPDVGTITHDVSGSLKTEAGDNVADVNVTVDAAFPEFPMTENVAGSYSFDLVENIDYTVTPERNKDFMNGVSTLDIVLIQKHILGIAPLNTPYKLIAADVSGDCAVNGSDLVQLRKLILGKYANDVLPSNKSWRFVESDYNFVNAQAPCNFSEVADIKNLTKAEVKNFVGVKVGDINGNAAANATMSSATRTNGNMEFVVADQTLTAGDAYTVDFLAKDFIDVFGFQYTLNLAGAEFVNVQSGALNVTENNFGLTTNGVLVSVDLANGVTVADDAVLFSITVKATANANVSEVISLNSNGLNAEAYVGRNLEVLSSNVAFRTNKGTVAAASFKMFQNEPNPFNGSTVIGFELPETSEATLTVFDVTGKVLYTKVDGYAKGYNTVTINRSDLAATGVLYYKLENGENVATMKMIVIE